MWEGILPLLEKLTWTLVFHNIKIVGNGDMPLCHAEFKDQNVSNAIVHINPKTTTNSVGVAKLIKRPTHHALKWKKVNYTCISSNVQTAKVIIRWILTYVCSGNIGSTRNGITKRISRFVKTGQNQFAQLWVGFCNDLWHFKTLFSKHSQK